MPSRTENFPNGSANTYSTEHDIDTDVLIVGAGVTGLTLSIILADYGVNALTIAKHRGTATSPRAHVTNQRTMEVFRDMGIEQTVRDLSIIMKEIGSGVMATSLTGLEVARYRCYGAGEDQLSEFTKASPSEMVNIPQNILEGVLLDRLRELRRDIRFSNELLHVTETPDGVFASVRERDTSKEYTIRARYLVAADGGRSTVAQQLGFTFQGQHGLMNMLTMWLEMDLEKYTAHRPACIYFLMQPGNAYWVGSGTCIIVKRWTEWLLNRQYDPADGEPDTSHAAIIAHARKVLEVPDDLVIKVKDASKWQVNNVFATEFQRGRVFLAGDAAHRHPPASGLGSNTCVQDAYNIAWKLAAVVQGRAGESLLRSYTQERQPVGEQIVKHAIETLYNMTKVPETLGFRKGQSVEEGLASLHHLFSDDPAAEARRSRLEEVVRLQDRRSNAIGLHLGHRYKNSCAVYSDDTEWPDLRKDPVLSYEPTTHPGAYLPHAWVQHGNKMISTLDVVASRQFGLIVGIGGKSWKVAADFVGRKLGIELWAYDIGYRCAYDDVFGEWRARREITDSGVILVRPDKHIAWRSHTDVSDCESTLLAVMTAVLGREGKLASL